MNDNKESKKEIFSEKNSKYWDICELIVLLEYSKWEDFNNDIKTIVLTKDFNNKELEEKEIKKFKINNQLLDKKGNLKSFKEQLNDKKINGVPYIVTEDGSIVTDQKRPITINKSTVNKILEKHGYQKEELYNLFERIKDYELVTESQNRNDSIIVFTNFCDNEGKPEMISIVRNKKVGTYEVDRITSIYGRKNAVNFIEKLYCDNKILKQNKKIKQWLKSIGVQFSKDDNIVLSDKNISQKSVEVNEINNVKCFLCECFDNNS